VDKDKALKQSQSRWAAILGVMKKQGDPLLNSEGNRVPISSKKK
jgi:hypothetical protein